METESTRLNHGYTGSLLQFVRSVAALVVSSGMSMSVPLCSSNCSALMQRLAGAPRWRRANPALLRYLCVFFSVAGTSLNAAAQTVVHGVVFDSLAGRALVGATVRMFALATPRDSALESMTDSVGRFRFADIPPGRYVIGFSHARLDSLGFDAVSRKVEFSQTGDTVALDIALPSGRTLVATLCGGLAGC